jgi:hypothetical protein
VQANLPNPADYSRDVQPDATPDDCIRAWIDVMNAFDRDLLAALRQEIGPEGDLIAAYRRWYANEMEEHDRMLLHMMEEFERRSRLARM